MKPYKSILLFALVLRISEARTLQTLFFEPSEVSVVGTLELQTFPGPPGYENIANGDAIESYWYLRLMIPVNVLILPGKKKIENNSSTKNVITIQLVFIDRLKSYRQLLTQGKIVKVFGKLFSQQTGHHHARVLAEVKRIEEVK